MKTFSACALVAACLLASLAFGQVRGPVFPDRCGLNSGIIARDLAIASTKGRQQRDAEVWSLSFLALELGLLGGALLMADDDDVQTVGIGILAGTAVTGGAALYSGLVESDAEKFARRFEAACAKGTKEAALSGYADLGRLAELARERRQTAGLMMGVLGLGLGALIGVLHAAAPDPTETRTLLMMGSAYAGSISLVAMGWHFAFRVQQPDELLYDSYGRR